MSKIKLSRKYHPIKAFQYGFTIAELMVGIAIAGIITAIALPNLSNFLVDLRVDNEISTLHRLLLTTRNTAINAGSNVIICPITTTKCSSNWHSEITVFVDLNNDGDYDVGDTIIKVKEPITSGDKLQYGQNSLTYTPDGSLSGSVAASPFSYCPSGSLAKSRGIVVSASGRTYVTSDTDNDGKDEDRSNNEITCS